MIWSNGRIMDAASIAAPNAWRRYLYLMLDAYRAERAHPLPEPPRRTDNFMTRWSIWGGLQMG